MAVSRVARAAEGLAEWVKALGRVRLRCRDDNRRRLPEEKDQTLRRVRANLYEPEPKLRERLTRIYEQSEPAFVRENVAVFVNMTPETFSGVYANAVKETHWLSYLNYAALVSGDSFSTDELAIGGTDIFIALDLKVLEAHPGLARC